jgi:DNA (cytosine-5)-methyltransferase 1
MTRVGSLCTGAAMLDAAVEEVFGPVERVFLSEVDPDASALLAATYPSVPNLADLDQLGYSVAWTVLGACKVGACHHRHRVYVYATTDRVDCPDRQPVAWRLEGTGPWVEQESTLFGDFPPFETWPQAGLSAGGFVWAMPADPCGSSGILLPTPRVSASRTSRGAILNSSSSPSLDQALELMRGELPRELESWDEAPASWRMLPTPKARDFRSDSPAEHNRKSPSLHAVSALLPTPRASDAEKGGPNQRGSAGDVMLPAAVQPGRFGAYEDAVRRQEAVFGLVAPEPTEAGRRGNPRLTPAFPEWMMGCPAGWITDHVDRRAAIRIAGNGVVRQAAALAYRILADRLRPALARGRAA